MSIEKLAYECGFVDKDYRCDNKFCGDIEDLEKFANAIRAEEREACADTAEAAGSDANKYDIADSIRARGDAQKDEAPK